MHGVCYFLIKCSKIVREIGHFLVRYSILFKIDTWSTSFSHEVFKIDNEISYLLHEIYKHMIKLIFGDMLQHVLVGPKLDQIECE